MSSPQTAQRQALPKRVIDRKAVVSRLIQESASRADDAQREPSGSSPKPRSTKPAKSNRPKFDPATMIAVEGDKALLKTILAVGYEDTVRVTLRCKFFSESWKRYIVEAASGGGN